MDIGNIQAADIDGEMRTAYLDYAMSVIVSRALPDARDGLKPVHRRILYGMYDLGIRSNTAYKKSARIVGEVLGKYHPHGDAAVYDAMARMAQDFSMRYMLVDGQGNFGSVDGDAPAAMRYTEARMSTIAEEMLVDIDKNTVDFVDNFDGSLQEPRVLPSRLPTLLLNGSSGIAVGMATNIPPHNLSELIATIKYLIDHYDNLDDVTVDDLLQHVKGPDFPTGAYIIGMDAIRQAYSTGRGRLVIRGKAEIEEFKTGRYAIIISEIPYQVNKANLIERIAELVRGERLEGITDLRDESDRRGMRIVIELRRGVRPQLILNQLYKYTALQSTFGVRLLALVDGEPHTLSLKRALHIYIQHRQTVITRRSQFELEKAMRRAHILDGLLIALANLDAVIKTIRESNDADEAKANLVSRFSLTEVQAQAILDMQLRRLSALERHKIEDEHQEIRERIAYLEDLLQNPAKILSVIKDDLIEIDEKYGDERRTRILPDASENFSEEDLVADEPVLISITSKGYVKRMSTTAFRTLGRGRRGVSGQGMREEDAVQMMMQAQTLNTILFFSDKGKVYSVKAYQIPEANRTDRGVPIVNVLSVDPDESITAIVGVPDFAKAQYCTMATVMGKVKRVHLSEFESVRPSGLIAVTLNEKDQLGWARITSGHDDILMVTSGGQALRFPETQIRPTGRQSSGVTGIKLGKGDKVTSMEVAVDDAYLLIVTEQGFGKRSPLTQYPTKSRASKGVKTIDQSALSKIGQVSSARVVRDEDEVTFMTSGAIVLRQAVKGIRPTGRATRGMKLMDVMKGDSIATMAVNTYNNKDAENGTDQAAPTENGIDQAASAENGTDMIENSDAAEQAA